MVKRYNTLDDTKKNNKHIQLSDIGANWVLEIKPVNGVYYWCIFNKISDLTDSDYCATFSQALQASYDAMVNLMYNYKLTKNVDI